MLLNIRTSTVIRKLTAQTSIRHKLLIAMLLAAAVPVILVTFLMSNNIYTAIRKEVLSSNSSSLTWAGKNLDNIVEEFSDAFYALAVNQQFMQDLRRWDESDLSVQHTAQTSLKKQLISTMNSDKGIKKIELYSMTSGKAIMVDYSKTIIRSEPNISHYIWDEGEKKRNCFFIKDNDDLSVLYHINRFEDRQLVACVLIRVNENVINDLFDIILNETGEQVILLNSENDIVARSPQDAAPHHNVKELVTMIEKNENKREYIISNNNYVFSKTSTDGRLRLIKTVPIKTVTSASVENMVMGIIIGIISSIIAVLLAVILSRLISKPVVHLADTMRTLNVKDFKAPELSNRNDEIGLLETGFDSMIKRMDELINIEYRSKIETRTAQLKALQAQINPHFLHNTLQLIGAKSLAGDMNDVYRITLALSVLMRYSMNFENEMVTIGEELKYLDNYLLIQNRRFFGRFEFDNNIPLELHNYMIPKLSLQPIIENCFEHGFEGNQSSWHINITGALDHGNILITVTDNGDGIAPERLKEIRQELNQPSDEVWQSCEHIGLKNVDTRLKLRYGGEYGIDINSVYGERTWITLFIKAINEVI